eukprot:CAMPEP_0194223274 /NCGR_PEP_ID=MMETSP0156-20130528/34755_1 /TAXON_ID=33649 /ORGANISM="Thalassionema nitzschioides, Strain L26-B" /LENGTH=171 /DNA_ID=CAMNT_0038954351 /DNA_START=314 /DNA_END=828 /DNA_ORIENTATION=+
MTMTTKPPSRRIVENVIRMTLFHYYPLLSSYLSTSTTDVTGQSNSSLAARACYVKGKLKGTSMEDSIKHKVHFVKSFDELLQLDHADDIYCRSCALEYCWEADWDNRVLQMTKSQQEEERERQEWREDNLKVQQQKEQRLRQRHDITSASTATRKYKQGSSNSNNNNKQLM